MGVYIKGMKMPKGCHATTHRYICPYWLRCKVYRKYLEKTGNVAINKRLDGCPLVEIAEPHGRLVDAEVVKDKWVWLWPSIEHFLPQEKAVRLSRIDDVPTIIESEE